jgi:hypothetical protein
MDTNRRELLDTEQVVSGESYWTQSKWSVESWLRTRV